MQPVTTMIYTLSLHDALPIFAADIAGVSTTHINHLTPRVLDIDELYRRMTARGVTMTDAIQGPPRWQDRKSTRLNSSHMSISYAVFCLKKKKKMRISS